MDSPTDWVVVSQQDVVSRGWLAWRDAMGSHELARDLKDQDGDHLRSGMGLRDARLPGTMAGCGRDGSNRHTHIQERPIQGQDDHTTICCGDKLSRRGRNRLFCHSGWRPHEHIKAASAAFFLLGH